MAAEQQTSTFHEWAEVTTAHGFSDFSRAKSKLEKMVWFLLIFICILLMCYQLYRGINEFTSYEWKTSIDEQQTKNQTIPSLILCNVNRLKLSKTVEYGMSLKMVNYLFYSINMFTGYIATNANATEDQADFVAWRKSKNFSYMDIFDKMAPNCEDIFLDPVDYCESPDNYEVASIDTYEYGRCVKLTANVTSTGTATIVGTKGGITLPLSVQLDEYLPLVYNNHWGAGIALQLSYSGVAELGQWTILNPGKRTSIAMSVSKTTVRTQDRMFLNPFALVDPQPPCTTKPSMRFSSDAMYSILGCQLECLLHIPYLQCNCIPIIKREGYRTCEAEEIINCMNATLTSEETLIVEKCAAQCQPLCYDRYVETQTTWTEFPSAQQSSAFDQYLIAEKIHSTPAESIILDVYFATLATTVIEQYEVTTFDNLISSSGGLIGLWCGMSFITVFQAIDYFIKFLKGLKQKRDAKTKLKSLPQKSLIHAITKGKYANR